MLKGRQSNFRGTCSCLLVLIGTGVHLNTAWAGLAANPIAPGAQSFSQSPMMLASTLSASPGSDIDPLSTQNPSAGTWRNYDLGPFDDVGDADKVIQFLENRDIKASYTEEDGRKSLGYIVVSPRFNTAADIRSMMDMLAGKGINDVGYMRIGDYAGRISMGVYSNQANARIRQVRLQKLGIDTDVILRSRTVVQWWIHLVGIIDEEQLLAELGDLVSSDQLSLERGDEVSDDQQQIAQPQVSEPSGHDTDLPAPITPVTEPTLTADEKKAAEPSESPLASQGQPVAETRTQGLPTSADAAPAPAQTEAVGPGTWLLPGLLLLVAIILAWYAIRLKIARRGITPSPLTALVSSTLNERDEGMLVLDDRQLIVLANNAFSRLVGKTSEDLKGQKISALGVFREGDDSVETLWGSIAAQATPRINVRVHLKLANNTYSTFLTSTSPLQTEEGAVSGTIVSFRPILELNDVSDKTDDPDQADIYRWSGSEFLERISPSNQLPVEAILRYAELLEQRHRLDPVEQQNFLNTISSDGSRLVNVLGTIVEFSKHHSGSFTLEKITFSPISLLQDIIRSGNLLAAEKGCQLLMEGAENLPDNLVSDPLRLRRILQYLCFDAIHRTNDGDVILRIRPSDNDAAEQLLVDIADQSTSLENAGLDDKYSYLERLAFEDARYAIGHELDLVIARQLVDELGGNLAVQAGSGGSACFALSIPVEIAESSMGGTEDHQAINEQLSRVEALAREEAASRASAEEQVNQERLARSIAQAEARKATEAVLVAEQRAARETEQKELLQTKLSAELETRRDLEEQARVESAARLSVEVDLLEATRQKEELRAAIARDRRKRDMLAASTAAARKDAEQRLQAALNSYQSKEEELAASHAAEAQARRDAEQRLETERKTLEQLQARFNEEAENRQALELRSKAEAEARSQIESTLAQERLARQELEDKLQEQLAASQALSVTIQGESRALADIETNLAAERVAKSGLEERLRRESSGKEELAVKIQLEAAARQAIEQTLIKEREEKQLLHSQLQAEVSARQELAERILAEGRARETAQRALEGKREKVLELEEKIRIETQATAELLARTRSETEARQLLGQQLQDEQEARAGLENNLQIDPQQQASVEEAVLKNVELQQAVAKEAAARETAERNLVLEINARKIAEAKVESEHQLNLKAQSALEEERQARLAAEQKVKNETRSRPVVQQAEPVPEQPLATVPDDEIAQIAFETVATRPFQIISPASSVASTGEPVPPLLTDRIEMPGTSPQLATEFTGDKSQRAEFVNQLGKHLKALDTQWELQNLEALAVTLRWVCQHAELFGIRDILLHSNELLEVVEAEAFGLVPTKLRYIKRLYGRIEEGKAAAADDTRAQADVDVADKIPAGKDSGKPNGSRVLTNQSDAPVRSSLNVSNPTIQRLVKRSAIHLQDLLAKMELCYQSEALKELVKLCYRLRGEADIAGLKALISPARQLEHYVNTGQLNRVENQLRQLRELLAGIEIPESVTAGLHPEAPEMINDIGQETVDMEKINSTLNLSNPKLKSRVQQFVVRLGSQLTELSEAVEQKDSDELTRISKWIVNYSRVMGFDVLSQLAQGLVDAVEIRDDQEIVNRLNQLRILFSRIEI